MRAYCLRSLWGGSVIVRQRAARRVSTPHRVLLICVFRSNVTEELDLLLGGTLAQKERVEEHSRVLHLRDTPPAEGSGQTTVVSTFP